jgi:hypothetical protein
MIKLFGVGCPSNRTWLCQASQPDPDHGEHDEGGDWAYRSKWRAKRRLRLIQAVVRRDPTLRQDDEFVHSLRLTISKYPTTSASSRSRSAWSLRAGMAEDALDEGELTAGRRWNEPRPVAVLNIPFAPLSRDVGARRNHYRSSDSTTLWMGS